MNFYKHYIRPLKNRGAKPFNPKEYFAKSYNSDAETIAEDYPVINARYHYNAIENSILEFLSTANYTNPSIQDIGSGFGHWLRFYDELLHPTLLRGNEINISNLEYPVLYGDITKIEPHGKFDIINAIGVFFHIIDDNELKQVITKLANHLEPGGVIIIGGEFGLITNNVQFENGLVTKRIRSLWWWKRVAKANNLKAKKIKTRCKLSTPENNILILSKK